MMRNLLAAGVTGLLFITFGPAGAADEFGRRSVGG